MPNCCLVSLLKKRKLDRDFDAARERLLHEMDLVHLIRNVRFFKMAIVSLLPSDKIALIKDKTDKASIEDKQDGFDN